MHPCCQESNLIFKHGPRNGESSVVLNRGGITCNQGKMLGTQRLNDARQVVFSERSSKYAENLHPSTLSFTLFPEISPVPQGLRIKAKHVGCARRRPACVCAARAPGSTGERKA